MGALMPLVHYRLPPRASFASTGYRHELNDSSPLTGALRVGQSIFGNQLQANVSVGFAMEF